MDDKMLIDAAEVAKMLSLHKKTFHRVLKTPAMETFPKPIPFGDRLDRWRKAEVEEWVNAGSVKRD
jgi:predicted DNA-binding transcriptional regulator AlpA